MKRGHCIGLDTHSAFCEMAAVNAAGQVVKRDRCETTIPALVKMLEAVPAPRHVVMEEGPLADWLWRGLRKYVPDVMVCEPRRNRLIAADGDKDDPVDAEKLAQLLRGGYVKAVHHPESEERAVFKQHVGLYHRRVRQRVREAHGITSLLRRHGVMVRERRFVKPEDRPALLERLPAGVLREDLESLWLVYDQASAVEDAMRQRLERLAKQQEAVCRFVDLPGLGWIRAATLFVYLDTPWRFHSKAALWRYLGIGLERQRSGQGPGRQYVPWCVNRLLKETILGAAKSAAAPGMAGKNPFADQYGRWLDEGLGARLARRNVARSLSATLWGLWKNGSVYRPEWVGVAAAASPRSRVAESR